MKSLIQYISQNERHSFINEYIKENMFMEGGHAVEAQPIPASVCMDVFNEVVEKIHNKYPDLEIAALGSTGKKKDDDFNGDIDTAVKIDSMDELKKTIDEVFPDVEKSNTTYKIYSIGYPYDIKGKKGIAQVDFMQVTDLKWAEFFWHSPSIRDGESNYKGGAAGDLLSITISEMPVEGVENEYYEDGQLKKKWKHTLNSEGIFSQLLDYTGKTGPLMTPKRPKEFQKLITKDPDGVVKFIFGDAKVDISTIYAAEKMWKAIHDPKLFKWQEVVPAIEKRYFEECQDKWGLKREDFPIK